MTPLSIVALSLSLLSAVSEPTLLANGTFLKKLVKQQFLEFEPSYAAQRAPLESAFEEIQNSMLAKMAEGQALPCSYQIATEIAHFLHYTCSFSVVKARLRDFNASLGPSFALSTLSYPFVWVKGY